MMSAILLITTFIVSSRGEKYVSVPLWKPNDPLCKGSTMIPGDVLKPNQFLLSENCIFQLIMQEDGNLVLYKNVSGKKKVTWTKNKYGDQFKGDYLVYQEDGNVCIKRPNANGNADHKPSEGTVTWCSGSYGGDFPTDLVMQKDGNLVAYKEHGKASWSSQTREASLPEDATACFSCTNVEITGWTIVSVSQDPETTKTNYVKFERNQCDLPATTIEQKVKRTTTSDVTKSYTWSKSMASTFSASLAEKLSISSSAGFSMAGFEAKVETTASIESSQSWTKEQSSTSTDALVTETIDTLETEHTMSMFYPANMKTTQYVWDKSYEGSLTWKATATCYSHDKQKIETQQITGTYHDVQFEEVMNDHDICDCSKPAHCTGMNYPDSTPVPTPAPTSGGGDDKNNRCGKDWATANSSCGNKACPDGTDAPCPDGQKCYADVKVCLGNAVKPTPKPFSKLGGGFETVWPAPTPAPVAVPKPTPAPVADVCSKLQTRGACRRNPLCSNRLKGCMSKKAMNTCKKYSDKNGCLKAGCKPRTRPDGSFKKCRPGN